MPSSRGAVSVALSDRRLKPAEFADVRTDDRPFIEFHNARAFVTAWAAR